MSSYNQDRFHYFEFDRAMEHYKANGKDAAEEICASLVVKATCPRLIQIQAWQLRSVELWRAKNKLEEAKEVCSKLTETKRVKEHREHPDLMLAELESIWTKRWAAEGREPPEEEGEEDASIFIEKIEVKSDTDKLAVEDVIVDA